MPYLWHNNIIITFCKESPFHLRLSNILQTPHLNEVSNYPYFTYGYTEALRSDTIEDFNLNTVLDHV